VDAALSRRTRFFRAFAFQDAGPVELDVGVERLDELDGFPIER